ncbi:hypothetical protein G3N92_22625, partial [Burkholderia sp. Ac-20379]|nr:hypothetical protein [Burkholderia sp. Ac-20379]
MSAPEFDAKDSSPQQHSFRITRRHFLGYGGALMGSTLLGACGGGGTDSAPAAAA